MSNSIVISANYFLYFGVMGIFLPYFNLYCYHLGFTGFEIGAISALRSFALIVFPIIWGWLADRLRARKKIFVLCNIISASIWTLFLFTTDFGWMLWATFFYGVFYAPIISFLEAFAMEALGADRNRYGHLRVWGSVSFILTVVVMGRIVDMVLIDIIVVLILCGSLIQAFISMNIKDGVKITKKYSLRGAHFLKDRQVVIFLVCAFLMLVSHGAFYGFFSIHLEGMGYSKTEVGLAWAVAPIAEIATMLLSGYIFKRFTIKQVIHFSFIMAVLRWFILYWADSYILILGSQLLHAATYGAFHVASILYMDLIPNEAKTIRPRP